MTASPKHLTMKKYRRANPFGQPNQHGLKARHGSRRKTNAAFTLMDLLLIVAIIAILPTILLPALNIAKKHAQEVGWKTYADYNGSFVMNGTINNATGASPKLANPDDVII